MGGVNLGFGTYLGSGPGTFSTHLPSRTNFGSTWKASLKDEKLVTKCDCYTFWYRTEFATS